MLSWVPHATKKVSEPQSSGSVVSGPIGSPEGQPGPLLGVLTSRGSRTLTPVGSSPSEAASAVVCSVVRSTGSPQVAPPSIEVRTQKS